jgi:hypothetical protein
MTFKTSYITVTVPFNSPKLSGNYMCHFDYNNIWILSTHAFVGPIWFYKHTKKYFFLYINDWFEIYNPDGECSLWGKIWMVLYQTNFLLHSGDLSTVLTTKVSMYRIYGGQIGREKIILLVSFSLSLSVSFIPRILCINFYFLATLLFRMTRGRSLRTFYESDIISKTLFSPFDGSQF